MKSPKPNKVSEKDLDTLIEAAKNTKISLKELEELEKKLIEFDSLFKDITIEFMERRYRKIQ